MGLVSGLKNTMELGMALTGPDGLEQLMQMAKQQGSLPQSSEQQFKAEISAQRKPGYRAVQATESALTATMAVVLILAGVGLLRDRAWALRLARYWAFYAIPASAVTVVMSVRYVLPEVPGGSVGGGMVNGAIMLLAFWAFPVLLLRHLPTQPVKDYLAQRAAQRGEASYADRADAPTVSTSNPPAAPRSTDSTWRDDPWNDPSSR